jgi:hypothetical protein
MRIERDAVKGGQDPAFGKRWSRFRQDTKGMAFNHNLGVEKAPENADVLKDPAKAGTNAMAFTTSLSVYEIDFEEVLIESLLDVAFVACPACLSGVVSVAIELDKQCQVQHGRNFPSAKGGEKGKILAIGQSKLGDTPYTAAEIINACANCFKHRDEWASSDWGSLKGQGERTDDMLQNVGPSALSDENLRIEARALGNPAPYTDLRTVERAMVDWGEDLREKLDDEMAVIAFGHDF